jgi:hypothetical protein
MIAKAPPQTHSSFAAEGTAAHSLAEECLIQGVSADGYVNNHSFDGFNVDFEMADAVQIYLDLINLYMQENPGFELEVEKNFKLDIHPEMWGTCDAVLSEEYGRLVVIDYKHGKGEMVEIDDNHQLLFYALGAYQDGDYSEIETIIVQPRKPHKDGPIRSKIYTPEAIEAFAKKLKKAAVETEKPDAKCASGDWCKWCPAEGMCTILESKVKDLVQMDGGNLPAPQELTPTQIKDVLNNAKLVEDWIKGVRTYALHVLKTGGEVEEQKLVQSKTNRQWIDKEKAKKAFKKDLKKILVAKDPELMSPAQVEKTLGSSCKSKVAELTFKPDGGCTIAHISDPRKEYTPPVNDLFDDISGGETEGVEDLFSDDKPTIKGWLEGDVESWEQSEDEPTNDTDDLFT